MKRIVISLLLAIVLLSFSSCNNQTKTPENNVYYSTSQGVKIETLSQNDQAKIAEYVEDCKIFLTHAIKQKQQDDQINPYVSYTDVFVYDFTGVDPNTFSEESKSLWTVIKELHNNSAEPVMYISFNGFASYFSNIPNTTLLETAVSNGFFIYSDNTVIPLRYNTICQRVFTYQMIDGTTVINCGNTFSEEIVGSDLQSYSKLPAKLTQYD